MSSQTPTLPPGISDGQALNADTIMGAYVRLNQYAQTAVADACGALYASGLRVSPVAEELRVTIDQGRGWVRTAQRQQLTTSDPPSAFGLIQGRLGDVSLNLDEQARRRLVTIGLIATEAAEGLAVPAVLTSSSIGEALPLAQLEMGFEQADIVRDMRASIGEWRISVSTSPLDVFTAVPIWRQPWSDPIPDLGVTVLHRELTQAVEIKAVVQYRNPGGQQRNPTEIEIGLVIDGQDPGENDSFGGVVFEHSPLTGPYYWHGNGGFFLHFTGNALRLFDREGHQYQVGKEIGSGGPAVLVASAVFGAELFTRTDLTSHNIQLRARGRATVEHTTLMVRELALPLRP